MVQQTLASAIQTVSDPVYKQVDPTTFTETVTTVKTITLDQLNSELSDLEGQLDTLHNSCDMFKMEANLNMQIADVQAKIATVSGLGVVTAAVAEKTKGL